MPTPTLAFLQNFYTDVTLYVPAELSPPEAAPALPQAAPAADAPAVAAPVAVVPPTPVVAIPAAAPAPVAAPAVAAPVAVVPPTPAAAAPPVPAPAPATPVPAALHTPFSTLGDNREGVVILVRLPAEQFLKLPRNVFLNKLLQAIGLVMADVVLVNVEHEKLPLALVSLRRELAATRILAFGRYLLDVTVRNTQIYEPVQFPQQQFDYLAAAEVEMVEYDVSLKKRLWAGLQRMFLA